MLLSVMPTLDIPISNVGLCNDRFNNRQSARGPKAASQESPPTRK